MEATPVPRRVRERMPLLVMMSSVSWACGHRAPQRGADTGQGPCGGSSVLERRAPCAGAHGHRVGWGGRGMGCGERARGGQDSPGCSRGERRTAPGPGSPRQAACRWGSAGGRGRWGSGQRSPPEGQSQGRPEAGAAPHPPPPTLTRPHRPPIPPHRPPAPTPAGLCRAWTRIRTCPRRRCSGWTPSLSSGDLKRGQSQPQAQGPLGADGSRAQVPVGVGGLGPTRTHLQRRHRSWRWCCLCQTPR